MDEVFVMPIRTVLHPTDFSEQARSAFPMACSLAHDFGARVVVLHVAPPPIQILGGMAAPSPALEEYDPAVLGKKVRELHSPYPDVPVEARVETGDAAATILKVAEETACDLIVMGTHGRTGLGRLLMGSVAEQVVRKANCPVLTVKVPMGAATRPMAAKEAMVGV